MQEHTSKTAKVEFTEQDVLNYHSNNFPGNGKVEIVSKTSVKSILDLTLAYSPGVAVACNEILKNPKENLHKYTNVGNSVAVISNGTRILGLGDIGIAGLPVMEGKSILFKVLGGVDAYPFVLNEKDPDQFISHVKAMAQNFGGINLEDIRKPDCFYIERTLDKELDIPVFHDDQWGTAIVTIAGLYNALKLVDKKMEEIKVVVNGAGAAGIAIASMLLDAGVKGENLLLFDRVGSVYSGREEGMDPYKEEISHRFNPKKISEPLDVAVDGADVLIGVSHEGAFKPDHVRKMADDAIVFGLANPVPEILPKDAIEAGAKIVATGRSDFANQINNVLGFPAIFRGALDVKAKRITENMKVAAAKAIANALPEERLDVNHIIVKPTDPLVMPLEAKAVAEAAIKDGVAQNSMTPDEVFDLTLKRLEFYNKYIASVVPLRKNPEF
ncbi:MAG: NADP-dependent malic enzyme [Methanobacteriota archaeon]|nr:MAG: NADP-dependent malic enzyme [Euryarchaeota archaeon]